jgi:arylsulfatase A-like enzyme
MDFSDMLPTFVELGGGKLPKDFVADGVSIAPHLLGNAKDTERKWIMALGYGAAKLTNDGIRPTKNFSTRVIRDKRFKVWVSNEKKIIRLHDLKSDPWEETNLIESELAAHQKSLQKFQAVVDSLPDQDAYPSYEPRASNPWDRK